jgi:hypothetical protein
LCKEKEDDDCGFCDAVPCAKKRRMTGRREGKAEKAEGDSKLIPVIPWSHRQKGRKSRKSRRGQQVDTGDPLEPMLGVEGGDLGQESGSSSSSSVEGVKMTVCRRW